MAYGDEHAPSGFIPWEEFTYTEYLLRIEELLGERSMASSLVNGDPITAPTVVEVGDKELRRCNRALEETALEFAAHTARLRLGGTY